MHHSNRWATNDEGSAALEFMTVGAILLVPLVYLIVTLGVIQEQSLGIEAAARHTARVIALSPSADVAKVRSQEVIASIAAEYGMDPGEVDVTMACAPAGTACPSAGATVTITVTTGVSLPLVPAILGLDDAATIQIEASAVQKISRSWGEG
jgi:Flp pilus assembly protein TadG